MENYSFFYLENKEIFYLIFNLCILDIYFFDCGMRLRKKVIFYIKRHSFFIGYVFIIIALKGYINTTFKLKEYG